MAETTYSKTGSQTADLKVWYDGQEEALQGTVQPVTVKYVFTENAGKLNVDLDFGDRNIVGLVPRITFDNTVYALSAGNKVSFDFNDDTFTDGQEIKIMIWYVAAKTGDEKFPELTYVYGKGVKDEGQGGGDDPQPPLNVVATCSGGAPVLYTPEGGDKVYGYLNFTCDAMSDGSLRVGCEVKDNIIGLVPKLMYTVGDATEWVNESTLENGVYYFSVKGPFTDGQEIALNIALAYAGGQSEIGFTYKYASEDDMFAALQLDAQIADITVAEASLVWKAAMESMELPATLVYSLDNANSSNSLESPVKFLDLTADTEYTVTLHAEIELSGEIFRTEEQELTFRTLKAEENSIDSVGINGNDADSIYYNLAGVRVHYPAQGMVVICKKGEEVTKFVVK